MTSCKIKSMLMDLHNECHFYSILLYPFNFLCLIQQLSIKLVLVVLIRYLKLFPNYYCALRRRQSNWYLLYPFLTNTHIKKILSGKIEQIQTSMSQ